MESGLVKMGEDKVSFPTKIRRAIAERQPELGFWIGIPLSFYMIGAGCYFFRLSISALIAGNFASWVWIAFASGVLVCWFGCKTIVVSVLTIVLLQRWNEHNFRTVESICFGALKLLSKSPLLGGAEIVNVEVFLANAQMNRGLFENAEQVLRKSLSRLETTLEHSKPEWRVSLANFQTVVLGYLTTACNRQGKFLEARSLAERAVAVKDGCGGNTDALLRAVPLVALARCNMRLNELDKAEEQMIAGSREVEASRDKTVLGEKQWRKSREECRLGLSLIWARKGEFDKAAAEFRKYRDSVRSDRIQLLSAEYLYLLANEFMRGELFEEAESALDLAYGASMKYPDTEDARQTLNYFEKLLILTGRQSEVDDMRRWLRSPGGRALVARLED